MRWRKRKTRGGYRGSAPGKLRRPVPLADVPVDDGPGFELWDEDGPLVARICMPMMLVHVHGDALNFYPGPHLQGKILRDGMATTGMWFPNKDSGVPFIRVDYPEPMAVKREWDAYTLSNTPVFITKITDLYGEGVHG